VVLGEHADRADVVRVFDVDRTARTVGKVPKVVQ
jgi:hypothetical protein